MSDARDVSRRGFLRAAAAGIGAAAVVGPRAAAAPRVEAPRGHGGDINVALIGAGTQGRDVLLMNCVKIPGVRFRAVCDIWPFHQRYASRLLARYKQPVATYADYREMLAKEPDLHAAIIATPEGVHAEQTIACLRAGLHVYCEKEMSNDLAQARAMVHAERETGRLLQIGHQRRSNPRYRHTKEKLIDEARLFGRITHAYGQWNRAVQPDRAWPAKHAMDAATLARFGYASMHEFRNWRWFKKHGGGPIVDLGSHQIDVFGWFLGTPPSSVMASGGLDYYRDREWPDNAMAIYEFETKDGVVRAFYQVLTTTSARGYYENFMGDEGAIKISEPASKVRVYAEARTNAETAWAPWVKKGYIVRAPEGPKTPPPSRAPELAVYESAPVTSYLMPVAFDDPYHRPHLENFFDAIRGKAALHCPGAVGYETAVQVLGVNDAIAAGRRLDFKPEDFKA